MTSSVLWYY